MNAMRIVGVLLLVVGLAGFLTGGFSFTKDTTQAKLGPLELTVKEKESVNIPQWMSLGAMVLGGVVLGVAQNLGAQVHPQGFLIAGHATFLVILLARLYASGALRRFFSSRRRAVP